MGEACDADLLYRTELLSNWASTVPNPCCLFTQPITNTTFSVIMCVVVRNDRRTNGQMEGGSSSTLFVLCFQSALSRINPQNGRRRPPHLSHNVWMIAARHISLAASHTTLHCMRCIERTLRTGARC